MIGGYMKKKKMAMHLTPFVFLAVTLLLLTACAGPIQYQRIGSPRDFNSGNRSSIAVYGCPSVYVNIAVAGRQIGQWFGGIGGLVGAASDTSRNEQFRDLLLKDGIQKYASDSIEKFFRSTLVESKIVSITDTYFLTCKQNEASELNKQSLLEDKEKLAVDSFLSFMATNGGDILHLEITAEYSNPGSPRNVIWKDVYVYESLPSDLNSTESPGVLVKRLFDDAFNILKPWIRKDIEGTKQWYLEFPMVSVKYSSGLKEDGYLLQDSNGLFAIRPINGLVRIVPKKYVDDLKIMQGPK
jgi:hypothetical protein